jgi:SPP1 gp7 family putative phage head morphogenesis protein
MPIVSPKTQEQIQAAVDKYIKSLGDILKSHAAAAFIAGDLKAQRRTGQSVAFNLVNEGAYAYLQQYEWELVDKGGCTIHGQFNPWLAQYDKDIRDKIYETIKRGITEGWPTGVKGTAPKESIAAQLKEIIHRKDSDLIRIARTETARIQMEGSTYRYWESGITQVKWAADADACDECKALNGKIFNIKEMTVKPPLHPYCECDLIPVVDIDKQIKDLEGKSDRDAVAPDLRQRVVDETHQQMIDMKQALAEAQFYEKEAAKWKVVCELYQAQDSRLQGKHWVMEYVEDTNPYKQPYLDAYTKQVEAEQAMMAAYGRKNDLEKAINTKGREIQLEVLGQPDSMHLKYTFGDKASAYKFSQGGDKYILEGFDYLGKLLDKQTMAGNQVAIYFNNSADGRAFSRGNGIWIDTYDGPNTVIHEIGHVLEGLNPKVYKAAKDFLDKRTKGEAPVQLKQLFPGSSYDSREVTRKDNFMSPYMGKEYPAATEIISMGLQYLYEKPVEFAATDPEYYELMINILKGNI